MANKYKKIALSLSIVMVVIWFALGTSTSLAWFVDTDEEVKNVFQFADFELKVEYLGKDGNYHDLEGATDVFDDEALYEPGYVQVVYLRVTNKGSVPFKFKTAVRVTDYQYGFNVFGQRLILQNYLRFGLTMAETQEELTEKISPRDAAVTFANEMLDRYAPVTALLNANDEMYVALIVRMPEEIDNVANYRGSTIPKVELGITVTATQTDAPDP